MNKKRWLFTTILLVLLCLLAGCSTSKSKKGVPEATTAQEVSTSGNDTKTVRVKLEAEKYVKLGKYKGLTIKGASTKVTSQDVENEISRLAEDYAEYKKIKDRNLVKAGDYLNVDYSTTIDGKNNKDYTDFDVDIHLGEGNLNADEKVDVDEKLIGARVGEKLNMAFTFPEDYDDFSVAGKKATLTVTVKAIEKKVVPEINDAFIKENTDCKTVEEYRKQVYDELVTNKKEEAVQTNQERLWKKIVKNADQIHEFPEKAVAQEISNVEKENKEMADYFGQSMEELIDQYYGMSVEDYAKDNLKKQCVQDLLVKKEHIEITEKELNDEIQYYIDELGYKDKEDVLATQSEENFRADLQYNKLMTFLMKNTTIKEKK